MSYNLLSLHPPLFARRFWSFLPQSRQVQCFGLDASPSPCDDDAEFMVKALLRWPPLGTSHLRRPLQTCSLPHPSNLCTSYLPVGQIYRDLVAYVARSMHALFKQSLNKPRCLSAVSHCLTAIGITIQKQLQLE